MTRGGSLYKLQNLDQEIEHAQRRISEIQTSLGETQALRQARQALADAEKQHKAWGTKTRDLELEMESLSNKIKSSERRLYSGNVTNPKELGDMQEEIASLKRRRTALEDELLEAMVYSEETAATKQTAHATLTATEAQWQTHQTALQDELGESQAHLEATQTRRAQLRQTIAAADISLYDQIRTRYGPIVVATLRDGVCSFCAVAPSSTKLKRLHSARELLQCSNCKRILLNL